MKTKLEEDMRFRIYLSMHSQLCTPNLSCELLYANRNTKYHVNQIVQTIFHQTRYRINTLSTAFFGKYGPYPPPLGFSYLLPALRAVGGYENPIVRGYVPVFTSNAVDKL